MARLLRLVLAAVITAAAAFQVVRLVTPADDLSDVRRQLVFLRDQLDDGAAERAQESFPEGYFFLYVLYGLAQVDVGLSEPAGERADELDAARWALTRLESEAGRAPFAGNSGLEHGVFYRGWLNRLRGGIVALQPADARDAAEVRAFQTDSAALGAAFDDAASPFLVAYPGQSWPVDSTVAASSLALHDRLFAPKYDVTLIRWTANVRARLDPATGLIPHTADPDTGEPTAGARATSQSLIHRFLPEIDDELARDQYLLFREKFLARPLALGPAVREYPHGVDGEADVDSGPLPLGISLSATVVTMGAAKIQGDDSLAGALANFGDVAGLPLDTFNTRRYLFGAIPIGDAFLAWSKSARPWAGPALDAPPQVISWWWRLPLLTLLLLAAGSPWVLRWWLRKRSV